MNPSLFTTRNIPFSHTDLCYIFIQSFCPVFTACRLLLVYDQRFFHMVVLLTFEARTCHCHFWNVSTLVGVCLPTSTSAVANCEQIHLKEGQGESFFVSTWNGFVSQEMSRHTQSVFWAYDQQQCSAFFTTPPFLLWPQPAHQQGSLLSLRKTGGSDC